MHDWVALPSARWSAITKVIQAAEDLAEMLVDTEYATAQEVDALVDSLVALEEADMTLAPPPVRHTDIPAEWEDEPEEDDD